MGNQDRKKREEIKRIALENFHRGSFDYEWYGFRIKVRRNKFGRDLDLDNVPKLIIDAFSGKQIDLDRSAYRKMKIYRNDTLRWIRSIQIEGKFTNGKDKTEVWIYGKNKIPLH